MARVEKLDKVMQLIEKELKKNPKATTKELQQKAKAVSASVGKLSVRQFHAKYPLQVRRKLAPKKPRRAAPKKPRRAAPKKPRRAAPKKARRAAPKARAARGQVNREAIRNTLMTFARDVSAAEGKSETIAVLGNLNKYIDAILRATR